MRGILRTIVVVSSVALVAGFAACGRAATHGAGSLEMTARAAALNPQDDALERLGWIDGVRADRTGAGLKLSVANGELFERATSNLNLSGSETIREIAEALREARHGDILIKSFSSSEGDDAFNLRLTQGRAASLREALQAHGIGAERLRAIGMGEREPVASNRSETGRARNRRIEIDVFPNGEIR